MKTEYQSHSRHPQRPLSGRGRGVLFSPAGRFQKQRSEYVHDGWDLEEEPVPALQTELFEEQSRSIISRNQSPDVPFSQSINPYRGCEHGCVYCYARPSHAYMDLSPGIDFESKIFYKNNAAELLEKELNAASYHCSPINIGANTDPYQPAEKNLKITRQLLKVLDRYNHPVTMITKGSLILRDIDILESMAQRNLVSVAVSVTTLDDGLKRILEPRTASAKARLKTLDVLNQHGIPTTVLVAPVIPAINDHEMESIVKAAAGAGVTQAHYIFLRLPFEVKEIFVNWLMEHFPMRAKHVMNLIGSARDGHANDYRFGQRMSGSGAYATMIKKRFERVCRSLDLQEREYGSLDTQAFFEHHPSNQQLSLL